MELFFMRKKIVVVFFSLFFLSASDISQQDLYRQMNQSFQNHAWQNLYWQAHALKKYFPDSPFFNEAAYYQGVSLFHRKDYVRANQCFSEYLKNDLSPKFFEESIYYKFSIAQKFHNGARKNLFGMPKMPKWTGALEDASEIYDEVIHTLPHHDLAARSLFSKADIQAKFEDYDDSIESYQEVIRKFPKNDLAPRSFLAIANVYLMQCDPKRQDPNLLGQAELNLNKFKMNFPQEEKIKEAEKMFLKMQEIYAKGLLEVGNFFSRTKKKQAAELYFQKIIRTYPETDAANQASKRLKN